MFTRSRVVGLTALAVLAWSCGLNAADTYTRASWQHREAKFTYLAHTSYYTCEGLEGKIREVLLHMGARKDLKVSASGCPNPSTPSSFQWVDVDYYALVPVQADTDRADVDNAHWDELSLTARRPSFMGEGECDLIEQMKPVIKEGFALNDLDYRTSCFPHQITMGDYKVTGRVLRVAKVDSAKH
jgi:hypothetical protein